MSTRLHLRDIGINMATYNGLKLNPDGFTFNIMDMRKLFNNEEFLPKRREEHEAGIVYHNGKKYKILTKRELTIVGEDGKVQQERWLLLPIADIYDELDS